MFRFVASVAERKRRSRGRVRRTRSLPSTLNCRDSEIPLWLCGGDSEIATEEGEGGVGAGGVRLIPNGREGLGPMGRMGQMGLQTLGIASGAANPGMMRVGRVGGSGKSRSFDFAQDDMWATLSMTGGRVSGLNCRNTGSNSTRRDALLRRTPYSLEYHLRMRSLHSKTTALLT